MQSGTETLDVDRIARQARAASHRVRMADRQAKDAALLALARRLDAAAGEVLAANEADLAEARRTTGPGPLLDRLVFNESKLRSRVASLEAIVELPDPVDQIIRHERLPNGLDARRERIPLGVVLMVYEARPHVTLNAGALCLKAGNAAILRGGREAARCNAVLGRLWAEALAEAGLPPEAVQVIAGGHEDVARLLERDDMIDLAIPRGGKGLIASVARNARMPVLKHLDGICHLYIDESADPDRAVRLALDSKCLMPEVCNAMETLLVHRSWADSGRLAGLVAALRDRDVTVRGCERTRAVAPDAVEPATEADWDTEYLDLILAVRVVDSTAGAIAHIRDHGSDHTDGIVTDSLPAAEEFRAGVDSAVVLVNASTMYCDGASLGMGAEIGIATGRLHARGPMGLNELTTSKLVIEGRGHAMGDWPGATAAMKPKS